MGPATRPLTLEQAKAHLRLDPSDTSHDDEVIDALDASVERVEHDCEQVLINQTFESRRFKFPRGSEGIAIDRNPVQSITEIKFLDEDGSSYIVLDPSEYKFDEGHRAIFPTTQWPPAMEGDPQSVVITFVAGYGSNANNVPRNFNQAVKLSLTEQFYGEEVGKQYEDLIRPTRRASYP